MDDTNFAWYELNPDTLNNVLHFLGKCLGVSQARIGMYGQPEVGEIAHSHGRDRGEICQAPTPIDKTWYDSLSELGMHEESTSDVRLCLQHTDLGPASPRQVQQLDGIKGLVATVIHALKRDFDRVESHSRLLDSLGRVFNSEHAFSVELRTLVKQFVQAIPWIDFAVMLQSSDQANPWSLEAKRPMQEALSTAPELCDWLASVNVTPLPATWSELTSKYAAFPRLESIFPEIAETSPQLQERFKDYSLLAVLFPDGGADELVVFFIPRTPEFDEDSNSIRIFASLAEHYSRSRRNAATLRTAIPVQLQCQGSVDAVTSHSPTSAEIRRFLSAAATGYDDVRMSVTKAIENLCRINIRATQSQSLLRLLRVFERTETLLHGVPFYRDHFLHSFLVYLLGYRILTALHDKGLELSDLFGQAYSQGRRWTMADIESAWLVTSCFHDISYPISAVEKWTEHLSTLLMGVPSESLAGFVTLDREALARSTKVQTARLGKFLAQILAIPKEMKGTITSLLRRNIAARGDHGVLSAIYLLGNLAPDTSSEHIDAIASAIAIHDNLLQTPTEREELRSCDSEHLLNERMEEMFNDPRRAYRQCVHFDRHPLAALLIYCDTLQEWGRRYPSPLGSSVSPHAEGPRLEAFSATSSNVSAKLFLPISDLQHHLRVHAEKETVRSLLAGTTLSFDIEVRELRSTPYRT